MTTKFKKRIISARDARSRVRKYLIHLLENENLDFDEALGILSRQNIIENVSKMTSTGSHDARVFTNIKVSFNQLHPARWTRSVHD